MLTKRSFVALAVSSSVLMLAGCSKEAQNLPGTNVSAAEADKNTFKAPALPSIYENADFKDLALAVDGAAQKLLAAAKASKSLKDDLGALTPLIQDFSQKRDFLLTKITANEMRQAAFSEVMRKNLATTTDRETYAKLMTEYYQKQSNPGLVNNVRNTPPEKPAAAAK